MDGREIEVGKNYAYRRTAVDPLEQVRVLERVRPGRWKVEFLDDPHPGLIDYVRSKDIVCRWRDRSKLLRDEKHMARLRERVNREWPGPGAYDTAVMYVLDATGEPAAFTVHGVMSCTPDVVERLSVRVDESVAQGPESFIDRFGDLHVGWADVLRLAQRFAECEPEAVLRTVAAEERQLAARGHEPGESWSHDYLRELGPAFAVVRQWVGAERDRQSQAEELERVQRVVWTAIHELRRLGHDREAAKVERALRGS